MGTDDLPPTDQFSRHEVLDRTLVIQENFYSHQALNDHPKLKEKAEEVSAKLAELYQAIAEAFLEKPDV